MSVQGVCHWVLKGDILCQWQGTIGGDNCYIENVLLVEDLKHDLLSTRKFCFKLSKFIVLSMMVVLFLTKTLGREICWKRS